MSDQFRALGAAALLVASALLSTAVLPGGVAAAADDTFTIDYEGDAVTVAADESQVISGSTELAPGSEVVVRTRSTDDTSPGFFNSRTTTVDRNGTWAAAFDFSDQSANDTFQVTVKAADSSIDGNAQSDGVVAACDGNCTEPAPEPVETVQVDATDGTVTVNDSASQLISGSALAPTGTEVSIRMRSTDSEIRFFKAATAVVTEDGTWATAVNFSGTPAGAEFSVEATIDGDYVASADGEVVACADDCRDQPPTDTPTPIPTATPEETATPAESRVLFTRNVVQAEEGATARMELSFDDTDTAGLVIGDEKQSGYALEATVRDGDGDGEATVRIDTGAAGTDGDTLTVSDGDEVTVERETELQEPIVQGEYELFVFPEGRSVDDASDMGVLSLAPAESTDGATATPTPEVTATGSPGDDGVGATGIVVSGALVLGGGALALLLLRG